jgi:hypothetical protein
MTKEESENFNKQIAKFSLVGIGLKFTYTRPSKTNRLPVLHEAYTSDKSDQTIVIDASRLNNGKFVVKLSYRVIGYNSIVTGNGIQFSNINPFVQNGEYLYKLGETIYYDLRNSMSDAKYGNALNTKYKYYITSTFTSNQIVEFENFIKTYVSTKVADKVNINTMIDLIKGIGMCAEAKEFHIACMSNKDQNIDFGIDRLFTDLGSGSIKALGDDFEKYIKNYKLDKFSESDTNTIRQSMMNIISLSLQFMCSGNKPYTGTLRTLGKWGNVTHHGRYAYNIEATLTKEYQDLLSRIDAEKVKVLSYFMSATALKEMLALEHRAIMNNIN